MFRTRMFASFLLTVCTVFNVGATTYYVDALRPHDSGAGTSWASAKKTIQVAIDVSVAGDLIVVTDGTYDPISTADKSIAIKSVNGAEVTFIDGGGIKRCATFGSNSTHTNTVLDGFTLKNGSTSSDGGGSSYGTLNNCILSGNRAAICGGGSNGGTLNNCMLSGNTALFGGGSFGGTLNNCILSGNTADSGGGSSSSILNNSIVIDNVASNDGGGSDRGTLNNCSLSGNRASGTGGGSSYGTLNNCTLSDNTASSNGGGSSYSTLNNCIVWGNLVRSSVNNCYESTMQYSCSDPMQPGSGNIATDPLFADAANGNFQLLAGSPCINAGCNGFVNSSVDLAGNPRVRNGTVDMGAYEFVGGLTVTFNAQGGGVPNPLSKSVTYGSVYGPLATTSRAGYTFAGWWTQAGGTGTKVTSDTVVELTAAQTLYAKWIANTYTVSFDVQGGSTPIPVSKNVTYASTYGSLATTSRLGYTFAGWWTEPGGMGTEVTSATTVSIAGPQTLYAKWEAGTNALTPVHRFWSDQFGSHFYIMGDSERDRIAAKYPGIWNYEAVAWYAYPQQAPGTEPVHRFWSDIIGKHFYIMGDSERDRIADKYRGVWNYEAVAWYAYPEAEPGTDPVGRFWSDAFMGHFYIITQSEIDRIAAKYPGIWNYETVAYWAYTSLPVGKRTALTDQVKFVAEKVNDASSDEPRSMAADTVSHPLECISSGIDVVYPLTMSDCQVAAYVYDSATEQWTCVLPVTNSPATAVLENVQPDHSYLLDVFAGNPDGGEMAGVYQSSFTYQLDPPELIHEDSDAVALEKSVGVGSPIVRIKAPAVDDTLTVKLYSSSEGVVGTLTDVLGSETVELAIPERDQWYWIGGWRDADNELVLSIWLRQETVE